VCRSEQQAGENSLCVDQGADDFAAWKNPFSYQCWHDENLVILRAEERTRSALELRSSGIGGNVGQIHNSRLWRTEPSPQDSE
jgi:hypothetical protein